MKHSIPVVGAVIAGALAFLGAPSAARAHCDAMDGPVIKDARIAISSGNVTSVLKWVEPGGEAAIREAFRRALAVRTRGPEARDLADQFFFETLVRIHREGEGEPFTGLKPEGAPADPAIVAADLALDGGSVEALARMLAVEVDKGLRERFVRVAEARKHAAEDVGHGRAYVSAYVEFIHYAQQVHGVVMRRGEHGSSLPSAHPH